MKKLAYLMGALSALSLGACSNADEPDVVEPEAEGTSSYFSFSIVSTNSASSSQSRAEDTPDYDAGTEKEGKIDNVVLFFYDQDNKALNVDMGNTNRNYIIIPNPVIKTENKEEITDVTGEYNVERWYSETVKLNTATAITSAKVAVIVNANLDATKKNVINSSGINISPAIPWTTFSKWPFDGGYTPDLFVMSSSAYYADDQTTDMTLTNVDVCSTEADAKKNQATLYVERVKARVKVIKGAAATATADKKYEYPVTVDAEDLPDGVETTGLKVKVLGWTANTTANSAYLFKALEKPSNADSWTWNIPEQHRSFWEGVYGSTNYTTAFTPETVSNDIDDIRYINPNTNENSSAKILVYTQLQDASGNPVSIATWYGYNYKYSDLKKAILKYFEEAGKKLYIKKEKEAGASTEPEVTADLGSYVTLTADEILLTQGSGNNNKESWMTYISLEENQIYYVPTAYGPEGQATKFDDIGYAEAKEFLGIDDLQGAKIWNDGYAYYYVDINHLGNHKGVVRNHAYTIEIEGFTGLGTPIYNPEIQIPKPDRPDEDTKSYVSVNMNVLTWRIVPTQKVTFK